jgi:predicted RNase H-like nuclease (RuvC/YqgF family)
LKPRTRERFLFDTLLGIAEGSVLEAQAAAEEGPRELAETRARLEVAEQLRIEETEQKQALRAAFETEKNELLNEIARLEKTATKAENDVERLRTRSEFKGKTKDIVKPDAFG